MTVLKDLAWVALIVVLLPVIMAVAFVAVLIITARSLYLWARGNLTATSTSTDRPVVAAASWWASWRARANRPLHSGAAPRPASIPAPAYAADGRRLQG